MGRVGCSIVWNYVDLVARNDTEYTFRIDTKVGERYLEGELTSDKPLPYSYKVFEKNGQFIRNNGDIFRRNEIWRKVIDKKTGNTEREELVKKNCALVTYHPTGKTIIDCDA